MKFYRYRCFKDESAIYKYKEYGTGKTFESNPLAAELKNGVVVFSYPTDFNDPYDCSLVITATDIDRYCDMNRDELIYLIKGALNDAKKRYGVKNKLKSLTQREINELKNTDNYKPYLDKIFQIRGAKNVLSDFYTDLRKEVKVACFTPHIEEILMWSHYSNSHKGYCIEYDIPDDDDRAKLHKVNYDDKFPEVSELLNKNNKKSIIDIACSKAKCWEYENEYRCVFFTYNDDNESIKRCCEYFDFKRYITAVYIGTKASEKNVNAVMNIAKSENFKVYKMELSDKEYRLIPREINK